VTDRARTALRRAFFVGLERLGRDESLARRLRRDGRIAVLNFHRVSPERNPFADPLDPKLFDELVRFLAKNCRVATPTDPAPDADDPRATVVVSFDDGCLDFMEHAAPVLARHGVRANHNVIGECVATGRPTWNALLYDFLVAAPASLLREMRVPGFDEAPPGRDAASKRRFAFALSRRLKRRPRKERESLWPAVRAAMDRLGDFPVTPMMRIDDVRAAATSHAIGCHSWSHESMEFEDDAFFADDFTHCRRFFADELCLPLTVYAFPNGSHREGQIEFLTRRGVERVLLVGEDYARADERAWPRFTMYGSSAAELRLRARGWRAQ